MYKKLLGEKGVRWWQLRQAVGRRHGVPLEAEIAIDLNDETTTTSDPDDRS
jgi:hypothetical protein